MGKLNARPIEEIESVHHLRYILFRLKTMDQTGEKLTNKTKFVVDNNHIFTGKEIKSIKEDVEKMDNFDGWQNFPDTWDVLWCGLDIRYAVWTPLRHNSPSRVLIHPLELIKKIKHNPVVLAKHQHKINEIPIPEAILREREKMFKSPAAMKQLEMDEEVSKFLSGGISEQKTKDMEKDLLKKRLEELDDED